MLVHEGIALHSIRTCFRPENISLLFEEDTHFRNTNRVFFYKKFVELRRSVTRDIRLFSSSFSSEEITIDENTCEVLESILDNQLSTS